MHHLLGWVFVAWIQHGPIFISKPMTHHVCVIERAEMLSAYPAGGVSVSACRKEWG